MKEVAAIKYQDVFGNIYDTEEDCLYGEQMEAVHRFVKEYAYRDMSNFEIANMIIDNGKELKAILSGDYSSVLPKEKK